MKRLSLGLSTAALLALSAAPAGAAPNIYQARPPHSAVR